MQEDPHPILVALSSIFFEGALLEAEGPGGAVFTPHHITANPEVRVLFNPNATTNWQLPDQGEANSTSITCGSTQIIRPEYVPYTITQTNSSWWQTSPICSQLGKVDIRPMGPFHSERVQTAAAAMATPSANITAIFPYSPHKQKHCNPKF